MSKGSECSSPGTPAGIGKRFALVLFIALCIEIGVFLLIFPWSEIWNRNLLPGSDPWLRSLYMNHYLRGAISGLGLVNLWLGVSHAWNFRALTLRSSESEAAR